MIQNIEEFVSSVLDRNSNLAFSDFKLQPPFEPEKLRSIFIDSHLPVELADILYLQHNGQEEGSLKLFGEFAFLGVDESFEIYKEMVDEFADYEMGHSADRRINGETIWRKKWFPFAWDQNNNDHLCLDFDPTSYGTIGQVIYCPRWGNHKVYGSCFAEFLNWYFQKLEGIGFGLSSDYTDEFNCRVNPFGDG